MLHQIQVVQKEQVATLKVTPANRTIGATSEQFSVTVIADCDWEAASDCGWLSLGKNSGSGDDMITVTSQNNTTGREREGNISVYTTIEGRREVHQVAVKQLASDVQLSLSTEQITFGKESGSFKVAVAANCDWFTDSSSSDWCKVTPATGSGSGSINVTATANNTGRARTAKISVATESSGVIIMRTVSVMQKTVSSELTVTPEEKVMTSDGGVFKAQIITAAGWKAEADEDWLSVGTASGNGDATLSITVGENKSGKERIGTITVCTDQSMEQREVRTILVTQSADSYYLKVPVVEYFTTKDGGQVKVHYLFAGNCTVAAMQSVDWVTWNEGDSTDEFMVFDVQPNVEQDIRYAEVSIFTKGQSGTPITETVKIWQSPTIYILDIFFSDLVFNPQGETKELDLISSIVPVEVRCTEGWCDVSLSGDNKKIIVTADANDSGNPRSATVRVSITLPGGELMSKDFTVTQDVMDTTFELKQDIFAVPYQGGSITAELVSVGDWEVVDPANIPSWINIMVTSGTAGRAIPITIMQNNAIIARNYNIIFRNTIFNKEAVLRIEQGIKSGVPIGDYMYLGRGYDVSGDYASTHDVKAAVLDWQKLIDADYLADFTASGAPYSNTIHEEIIHDYQFRMSEMASLNLDLPAFGGHIKASFSPIAYTSMENEFGLISHKVPKFSVRLYDNITAEQLRSCLIESVLADIDGDMEPDAVVAKYGTHVITGFVLGGSIDFAMSADRSAMVNPMNWEKAMSAGFDVLTTGNSSDAGLTDYTIISTSAQNISSRLVVHGGDPQYASLGSTSTKDSWMASLTDPEYWTLIDYTGSKLIPIWDFAMTIPRRDALESAARGLITTKIPQPVATHKTLQVQNTHIKALTNDATDGELELHWRVTYILDGREYPTERAFREVKTGQTVDVSHYNLSLTQNLSSRSDHTLEIQISGLEEDTPPFDPDDPFKRSITLNYRSAEDKWYIGANPVIDSFDVITYNPDYYDEPTTQHTIKLTWN